MNVTKFGQCCLLIEIDGKCILTDPGRFGTGFTNIKDIDLILITHEHADHFHAESLTQVLKNNQNAVVVCNSSVGKILTSLNIPHTVLEGRDKSSVADVPLEAYDGKHEEIFEDFGLVQNTGYFIRGELFYPGDAYTIPESVPRVLALPIAGPWCKLPEALAYAISVSAPRVFPVHDWLLNEEGLTLTYKISTGILEERGMQFDQLRNGETIEI